MGENKTLSIKVPIKIFEKINMLINKGVFTTKNDFVRYSILRTLEEYKNYLEGD